TRAETVYTPTAHGRVAWRVIARVGRKEVSSATARMEALPALVDEAMAAPARRHDPPRLEAPTLHAPRMSAVAPRSEASHPPSALDLGVALSFLPRLGSPVAARGVV